MQTEYSYRDTLASAERINWRIEDIIGGDKRLDFSKPFMPEPLARVRPLAFLDRDERLALNHIRGNAYLYIFGLVEQFILPFVVDHAKLRFQDDGDNYRVRALLRFANEEAKHIHLFKRFREEFRAGFGTECQVIGPPAEFAKAVLAHHPLAVALVTLHIEWMTQAHYVESARDDQDLDPQFKSLLRHHWMEEAQHAKLDTLMVASLATACDADQIEQAFEEYLQIGGMIDKGLHAQVAFDLASLEEATGRTLDTAEREAFTAKQLQANRWTYLGSGMTHENFLATLGELRPEARIKLEQISPAFC
jgi:hypothetical protein